MLQQILSPEFLLLQAMPALAMALGLIALEITFVDKMRASRKATPKRT